jgi:uncharacterized protein (DUF1697 family)
MISDNFQEVLKELRTILSQIKGVKNIGEDFTLNYLLLIDSEQNKADASKVTALLETQAKEKFGIALEILVLTKDEFDKAQSPTFAS